MINPAAFGLFAVGLTLLTGCKIIHESEMAVTVPEGQEGDDIRNAARLDDTFESAFLPHITSNATDAGTLLGALEADFEAAGDAYGYRRVGQGVAWNFPIEGSGTIVSANLDTSARTLDLDIDADGTGDLSVQLGPVIRGTALRDAAPQIYDFDDFRDQIEFAKLARNLNDRVKAEFDVPEGEIIGMEFSFVGVIPMPNSSAALVVTPVAFEFDP